MKRAVRQRCGFGCVMCGKPIVEYHHMTPWEEVEVHEADNLTLLCPTHHAEATGSRPLLDEAQVRQANAAPYNTQRPATDPYPLNFNTDHFEVVLGSNRVVSKRGEPLVIFAVDHKVVFGVHLEDGRCVVNLGLLDKTNSQIVAIVDNELQFASAAWDVVIAANRLTIRRGLRDIIFDVRFDVPNRLTVLRAEFWLDGASMEVTTDWLRVGKSGWSRNVFHHYDNVVVIGERLPGATAIYSYNETRLPGFVSSRETINELLAPYVKAGLIGPGHPDGMRPETHLPLGKITQHAPDFDPLSFDVE
jgi:hypothetical protein